MPKGIKGFQPGHVTTHETRERIGNALRRPIYFDCDFCGSKSHDKPSAYRRKKKHFCSQICYTEYKRTIPKESHPRFGSGNSLEERAKRRKARSDLNHYLRDKGIVRPGCEVCGLKAEAHHDNYDKPLNVRWLCFRHHREYHKSINENPELLK